VGRSEGERFCPYCGSFNPADFNFCGNCQRQLPPAGAVRLAKVAQPVTSKPPDQSHSTWAAESAPPPQPTPTTPAGAIADESKPPETAAPSPAPIPIPKVEASPSIARKGRIKLYVMGLALTLLVLIIATITIVLSPADSGLAWSAFAVIGASIVGVAGGLAIGIVRYPSTISEASRGSEPEILEVPAVTAAVRAKDTPTDRDIEGPGRTVTVMPKPSVPRTAIAQSAVPALPPPSPGPPNPAPSDPQSNPASCSTCGSRIAAGSDFCSKCGSPILSPTAASAQPRTLAPSFAAAESISRPSPRRKHGPLYWVAVGIGVIILIVIVVVIATILAAVASIASAKVNVTDVNFDYGTSYCPAHEPASAPGFTSSGAATVTVTTTFIGPSGNGSCRLSTIGAEEMGFMVTGSNLPLVVNAGQSASAWFDVQMPTMAYAGNLTIGLSVEVCGSNGLDCI
jgi:hypothetical protein